MEDKIKKIRFEIAKQFATTPGIFAVGPYTTTSDTVMPIYPDSRRAFSDPKKLRIMARAIKNFVDLKNIRFDFIFGGATAGIQPATAFALLVNKPMGYVRKEPKAGGMGLAVEGAWEKGMKVLLIDDALGHGAAKTKFVANIRAAGLKIDWVVTPFARNRHLPKYFAWAKEAKVNMAALTDINDVNIYAVKHKIITPQAATLLGWYSEDGAGWDKDPAKWQFFLNYKKMKNRPSQTGI